MRYFSTEKEELQFFTAGNLNSKNGFLHQKRVMDCCVLIFVLEGKLYITQNENEFCVSKGQYILLKDGETHFGHKASQGRLSYLWVHFKPQSPFSITESIPHKKAYIIPEYNSAVSFQRIGVLVKQLIDFSRQENLYTQRFLTSALSLVLMEITQQLTQVSKGNRPVSPIVYEVGEWIKSNCHRHSLSAKTICDEFHYNREYLSSLFKKNTGFALTEYLNRSRLDAAKNLLSNNDISIKEAAYSCGFNDEKYFMKLFRRYEGITPLQYKSAFFKK